MTEEKEITLPGAPSKHLMNSLRSRSLRNQVYRARWETLWSRVHALEAEGWRAHKVVIDWGNSVPELAIQREKSLRQLMPTIDVIEERNSNIPGVGCTTVYLYRQGSERD